MSRSASARLLVRAVRQLPPNRWTARAGRLLATALAGLGAEVVVALELSDGSVMQLDIRGRTEAEAVWGGCYDPDLIAFLKAAIVVSGPNVIDVGANVGLISIPIARHIAPLGGRLMAIEPVTENRELLRRSAALNRLANVEIVGVAIGSHAGTVSMTRDPQLGQTSGNASVDDGTIQRGGTVEGIAVRRLDDIVSESGIAWNVVKIDCEGYDVQVVNGAVELMTAQRPIIWGEFHTELTRRYGEGLSSLRGRLDDTDYQAFAFEAASRIRPVTLSDEIGNCALVPTELVDRLLDELARH